MKMNKEIDESNFHSHLRKRMLQRGISTREIKTTIENGWEATDAKKETIGKVYVFQYGKTWEGIFFEEKEVTVYYKIESDQLIILTAKARYGNNFTRSIKK
ncbi:DUF4258 domain-containing protein [bacterium]|nr:DUF4258 domain-containing protein [bacterium]